MYERRSSIERAAGSSAAFLFLWSGCTGIGELEKALQPIVQELDGDGDGQDWHVGPAVVVGETGTAKYVEPLMEVFDRDAAMELVRFVDRFYRAPANEGYDEVIDRMCDDLAEAGFDGSDERLSFEVIETRSQLAWTPRSGKLVLEVDGEAERVLHAFDQPGGVDRVMLPVNAPSCSVEGEVASSLGDLKQGMILVTAVKPSQVLRRAKARGAAAVVSASLYPFNEDTSGEERHLDAIQFSTLDDPRETMPVCQISHRTHQLIEAAVERARKRGARARLRFDASVHREERPMRTLVATIRGSKRPNEAVAMVSHVQEPGACDNASGVAGLLESAKALARLLERGRVSWPSRSLCFIWGDEFRQSEIWLRHTKMKPVIGISSDMTGQSKDTGAIALLERMPDPGALVTIAPDAHTPWGAGHVSAEDLSPNGLAVIARCAMIDVGVIDGNWTSADHPWEGGSDHDVFIRSDIPAVLFWHFTDFTYHTSLDRMGFVDPDEIQRTGAALLATALAVADPQPGDLERYLGSLEKERVLRVQAARDHGEDELAECWEEWCVGARQWLRNECLGIQEEIPRDGR